MPVFRGASFITGPDEAIEEAILQLLSHTAKLIALHRKLSRGLTARRAVEGLEKDRTSRTLR